VIIIFKVVLRDIKEVVSIILVYSLFLISIFHKIEVVYVTNKKWDQCRVCFFPWDQNNFHLRILSKLQTNINKSDH